MDAFRKRNAKNIERRWGVAGIYARSEEFTRVQLKIPLRNAGAGYRLFFLLRQLIDAGFPLTCDVYIKCAEQSECD